MAPPPFTPPMTTVGSAVTELFEQAFHPLSVNNSRPTSEAWIGALEALKSSLAPCKAVAWHHHPLSATSCPWCAIERPSRIKLFGGIIKIATTAIADLETVWARYRALVEPGPPRPLPVFPPKPRATWTWPQLRLPTLPSSAQLLAAAKHRVRSLAPRVRSNNVCLAALGLFVFSPILWNALAALARSAPTSARHGIDAVALLPWTPMALAAAAIVILLSGPILLCALRLLGLAILRIFLKPPMAPARPSRTKGIFRIPGAGRRDAERAWAKAAAAWEAQSAPPDLSNLRPLIEHLKRQLDALASEREAAIRACAAAETKEAQRARYLGAFRIEDAKLTNFGPARCAVLRSWGVDTAADIDGAKIAAIPGFGKYLTDKLVLWRDTKEKAFIPITGTIIDPHDVQGVDRRLAARRTKLMKYLREKITEVEQRMGNYVKERNALWVRVEAAYQKKLAYL
jgi:hypothetical protein